MNVLNCKFYKRTVIFACLTFACVLFHPQTALAAISPLNFTINMSEPTTVVTTGGTPRIAVNAIGAICKNDQKQRNRKRPLGHDADTVEIFGNRGDIKKHPGKGHKRERNKKRPPRRAAADG